MGKDDKPCSTILGLQCFDWQEQDGSKSNGLKCGDKTNCGQKFTYSQQQYMGMCDGLTGFDCSGDAHCDTLAKFRCADWVGAKHTPKCALDSDCGNHIGDEQVTCNGLEGDACTHNNGTAGVGCDGELGLKCGEEFSTSTFQFGGKAACLDGKMCGTSVEGKNASIHLCYGDQPADAKCDATNECKIPDGADAKALSCGWIAEASTTGGNATNVTHMCIDSDKYCTTDANLTLDYFGNNMTLECASVRTVLAMGAALISTYYAM
jgi:hypothetical protein